MWGEPGTLPSGLGPLVRGIFYYFTGIVGGPMIIMVICLSLWMLMLYILCWMLLNDAWKEFRGL